MSTQQALPASRRMQVPLKPSEKRHSLAWLWLVLLCLAGAAGYFVYMRFFSAESQAAATRASASQPVRAIPIVGVAAKRGDFPIYLETNGTVLALNTVTVHSRVDGQLINVAYHEGQEVKEGDLLAEIDPRPFKVELEQAQGQLAKDQATLDNARADLKRYQAASDAIPRQQVDTAAAAVAQAEGTIKSDQAQIDSANLQLTYSRITAPLSGRTGLRLVDQGNIVHASDPTGIVVITQDRPISVLFNLPQDDVPQLQRAMRASLQIAVDAYDRDLKNRLANGTLQAIDNQIDTTTATFRLKGVFDNLDGALYPNQFVNVRLLVDTRKDAILVPSGALQNSPTTSFVYVVKSDDTVEMRLVTVGPRNESLAVIDRGLNEGEIVVTDGLDKLQQGTKVSVRSDVEPQTQRRPK